jgi:hypothetical protein
MAITGIISGALSALGGVAGAVGKGAKGAPASPLSQRGAGVAPYQPTAATFGGATGGPPTADLRLSGILGQQQSPEDEMRLSQMMGYM